MLSQNGKVSENSDDNSVLFIIFSLSPYYIEDIFKTWSNENLPPKIHFSSPREFENDKKHSDFINSEDFISFLDKIKNKVNIDFDVMIEAKKKDQALFELADNLKKYDNKVRFIDKTTIETI